jgi:hypothetical protein
MVGRGIGLELHPQELQLVNIYNRSLSMALLCKFVPHGGRKQVLV